MSAELAAAADRALDRAAWCGVAVWALVALRGLATLSTALLEVLP